MKQIFNGVTEYKPPNSNFSCPPGLNSNGEIIFNFGKVLPSDGHLGIPNNIESIKTIEERLPDPYQRGSPLPRPYGPRDNIRLQLLEPIHGYGQIKKAIKHVQLIKTNSNKILNKLKKTKKLIKKEKKRSKKLSKKKLKKTEFGATPGTDKWLDALNKKIFGKVPEPTMLFYEPGKYFDQRHNLMDTEAKFNVPMYPINNKLNTMSGSITGEKILNNSFGSKLRNKNKYKKKVKNFGNSPDLQQMEGPNIVAYEPDIPMYHAGGTTIDFATNKLYKPIGIIGGPTNTNGDFAAMGTGPQIVKVQPDGITPNAFLNVGPDIISATKGETANNLLYKGIKNSFGPTTNSKGSELIGPNKKIIFTSNSYAADGPMYQPAPDYLPNPDINSMKGIVSYGNMLGSKQKKSSLKETRKIMTGTGSMNVSSISKNFEKEKEKTKENEKDKEKEKEKENEKEKEKEKNKSKISTKFNGNTITLTKSGQVLVT